MCIFLENLRLNNTKPKIGFFLYKELYLIEMGINREQEKRKEGKEK